MHEKHINLLLLSTKNTKMDQMPLKGIHTLKKVVLRLVRWFSDYNHLPSSLRTLVGSLASIYWKERINPCWSLVSKLYPDTSVYTHIIIKGFLKDGCTFMTEKCSFQNIKKKNYSKYWVLCTMQPWLNFIHLIN